MGHCLSGKCPPDDSAPAEFFFKSPFTFLGILLPQTQDEPHLFSVQVVDDGGRAEPRRVERVVERRVHRRHVHLQRHPSTQVFVLFGHTCSLNISPLLSALMRCLKCHQMQTSQVAVKMGSCQLVAVQLVLSHRPSFSLPLSNWAAVCLPTGTLTAALQILRSA